MIAIKFPFTISNGSVSSTTNMAEIITSRVLFCLGTQVGERVMHPTWGMDLMNSAMALGAEVDEIMTEAVQDAFSTWFPTYMLIEVKVEVDLMSPNRVLVDVRYGSSQSGVDEAIRIGVPMPDSTEMLDNERAY